MTDQRLPPVPRISRRRALRHSVLVSLVATTLILGGLWVQMSAGRDPALGPKLAAAKPKRAATESSAQPFATPSAGSDDLGGEIGGDPAPSTTLNVAPTPTPTPAQQLAPVQTSTS